MKRDTEAEMEFAQVLSLWIRQIVDGNIQKKITSEYIQTFSLLLFPKEYNNIYTEFTLY